MRKVFFTASLFALFSSFNASAFTDKEWANLIVDTIDTKDDLSWSFNVEKLKTYSKMTKESDIKILESIAKGDDYQISQAAKYLLSLEGVRTNEFIINNYLDDSDVKNGLYYVNANFINTPDKKNFWSILKSKEIMSIAILKDEFENCKDFQDVKELGGTKFTLESFDDFFDKRDLISGYTNADLMYLELDLSEKEYPVDITVFQNKYVFDNDEESNCSSPNKSLDFNHMQKITALYKQYQKVDKLKIVCENFDENKLLKSKFSYLCN